MSTRRIKERNFSGTTDPTVPEWEIKHRAVARRAAADGIVLLKNENHVLPIDINCPVALYGAGASHTIKGGTGSGDVNERECVSIYQGMKNAGYHITSERWIAEYDSIYDVARCNWRDKIKKGIAASGGGEENFFPVYCTNPFRMPAGPEITKKEEESETAVFVISRIAGEGADRQAEGGDYFLTEEEHCRLEAVCRLYQNVVIIVNAGGQIDLSFLDEFCNIKGLLILVQPGMEGGNALADILSGKVNPSGKLTDSWAYQYEDYPNSETFSHNNGNVEREYYEEGIYVGYRYFDTFGIPVRYEFGFGLSYTEFALSDCTVKKEQNGMLEITAKVKNTGDRTGKEVVEVYASLPDGRMEKEARRLIGFTKTTELKPQEEQTVKIQIPWKNFASYDEAQSAWILEEGKYGIELGNSLGTAQEYAVLQVTEEIILEQDKKICGMEFGKNEITCKNRKEQADRQVDVPVIELHASEIAKVIVEYRKNAELYPEDAMEFVHTLTKEECMKLASGDPGKAQGSNLGAAGIVVPGSAGETSDCVKEKGLASLALADGPAGLRLTKYYYVKDGKIVYTPIEFNIENGFLYDGEEFEGTKYYQYCTAIPVGTLLAQTWDTGLVQMVGHMIGEEMEHFGVSLWLAPGMNIHRNPLCGRNFEYYSEDPLVSGKIAAAMTEGVQKNPGCGTTIKHFACNNQEDNRQESDSILSERALREIYLRGFEIAVRESQPYAIMTSYNRINGIHAANNFDICTEAARNEWGFKGLIMTDWTTTMSRDCTAAGCMRAGNDLVMPGSEDDYKNLEQELSDGSLSEDDLRACVARLVSVCWKSNQYEEEV